LLIAPYLMRIWFPGIDFGGQITYLQRLNSKVLTRINPKKSHAKTPRKPIVYSQPEKCHPSSEKSQSLIIPARQGLVCSEPESLFQDQNKPTKKTFGPLRLGGSKLHNVTASPRVSASSF